MGQKSTVVPPPEGPSQQSPSPLFAGAASASFASSFNFPQRDWPSFLPPSHVPFHRQILDTKAPLLPPPPPLFFARGTERSPLSLLSPARARAVDLA